MYERALGEAYARLPAAVQRLHRLAGRTTLQGWVQTQAPAGAAARLLAWCLGTPRHAGSGPLRFELDARPDVECWTRHFPRQTMTSRLRLVSGKVVERLGATTLTFELRATERALTMELVRLRVLGLPCPRWLLPSIVAEETGSADEFRFRVAAVLPLVGLVASYQGHLDLGHAPGAGPQSGA